MNKEKIAYLAGLIDADGTIAVSYNGSSTSKHIPYVSISNTNRKMLEWCRKFIGKGAMCTHKPSKPHHSVAYSVRWTYNTALYVAKLCEPYLIIKKKRAELMSKWKSVTKRNGKYSSEEWAKKQVLIAKMYRLNKKGNVRKRRIKNGNVKAMS